MIVQNLTQSDNETVRSVEPVLLSAQNVSKYLCMSRSTLYRLVSKGEIPEPIRFGSVVRWRKNDLDFCMSKRGINPSSLRQQEVNLLKTG